MKKWIIIIASITFLWTVSPSCSSELELAPISSISDVNFWQTPEQFDAFVSGIHARMRSQVANIQALGELRSDVFGTEPGSAGTFSGEATEGFERFWLQTLDLDFAGVPNFGGFYTNIVQINQLISRLNSTSVVSAANKSYYLGIAYGMRAFYYYRMTTAWGDVVLQTEPLNSFDVSNLAKEATPASVVMDTVMADIEKSLSSFGADYSFRNQKGFWSRAATLMLKAEVYLWQAHRNAPTSNANIALAAINEIQTRVPSLNLRPTFAEVFAAAPASRGNSEIIFSLRNLLNESLLPFGPFLPQTNLIINYFDSAANRQFNVVQDNWGGVLRAPIRSATFRRFLDIDSRKRFSIQAAYTRNTAGNFTMAGCFARKFEGEQEQGVRRLTNDYPIYRFSELLLLKAEAKVLLGQSPAEEIDLVRRRAYGTAFAAAQHAYPNQPGDADPKVAILNERLFEFIFEGKRWMDLRRFGDSFVFANTAVPASQAYKLLWPIDRNSLTNNRSLKQNPGYPAF